MHDGLPPGLSTADDEVGRREARAKLAALVEAGEDTRGLAGPARFPGGGWGGAPRPGGESDDRTGDPLE